MQRLFSMSAGLQQFGLHDRAFSVWVPFCSSLGVVAGSQQLGSWAKPFQCNCWSMEVWVMGRAFSV